MFAIARVSVHSIGAVVSAAAESFQKWSNWTCAGMMGTLWDDGQ